MNPVLLYFVEGPRIMFSSWGNKLFPKRYPGKAPEICKKIIDDCWNGRYFQTSTHNFKQFWTRDFFWCCKSLLELGYQKEVQQTLRYALNRFKKYRKIASTLTPGGSTYDFPRYSVDSLPAFIHCLRISKFPYYDHKDFLNQEIFRFFKKVIDPKSGLVKSEEHFASMKDLAIRKSSCYDNCQVAMLASDLAHMKLYNPFKKYDYQQLILDHFWNGKFFYDDLNKNNYVAGDANLFPFLLGVVKDKEKMEKAVEAISAAQLDQPFPLKYTSSRDKIRFVWEEFFFRDYESNSIWMHLGPLYVKMLQQVDKEKAAQMKQKYTQLIETHGNFLEVFTPEGQPYSRLPFYYCDSGMLWAANYLTL